jgi:hypothetical protein
MQQLLSSTFCLAIIERTETVTHGRAHGRPIADRIFEQLFERGIQANERHERILSAFFQTTSGSEDRGEEDERGNTCIRSASSLCWWTV